MNINKNTLLHITKYLNTFNQVYGIKLLKVVSQEKPVLPNSRMAVE